MLSFGQCTEGMHNVMFCVFQHLDTQVCGGEENRESQFNTVAHSFIHYKLSLYDSPGPVLCAEADMRVMGGL